MKNPLPSPLQKRSIALANQHEEFNEDSKRLINAVLNKKVMMLLSDVVVEEIREVPAEVQQILGSIPIECIEIVSLSAEVKELRDEGLNGLEHLHYQAAISHLKLRVPSKVS